MGVGDLMRQFDASIASLRPRERGIIFTGANVLSILDDRKTQTRRILKADHLEQVDVFAFDPERGKWEMGECHQGPIASVGFVRCPYGQPGDLLYVKETWHTEARYDGIAPSEIRKSAACWFVADGKPEAWGRGRNRHVPGVCRPSLFMPRWASRLTLEVTDVRVEPLNDISEADAIADGVEGPGPGVVIHGLPENDAFVGQLGYSVLGIGTFATARAAYRVLWESIHGTGSWAINPWCWCVSFRRLA